MSFDGTGFGLNRVITRTADADLSALQHHLVKLTATGVAAAGAGERAIGILQNAPESGQLASVMIMGISQLVVDGTTDIAVGDALVADASAHGVKVAATVGVKEVSAVALEGYTTDDANGLIEVILSGPQTVNTATT